MLPFPGGGGDEFEVDFDTLSSGLLGDVTPEMLRFLTGASVHSAAAPSQVPAKPPVLPLGPHTAESSSKQQRAGALLTEQSLADGSFEAGLAPFQLLVSQSEGLPAHDGHDTSSIPTENDSILRNLSDFGSRDSSGSDNGARFSNRRRRPPPPAAASTFRSPASTKGRSSASGGTGDASKPLPLSSVVQMQQAVYKDWIARLQSSGTKRRAHFKDFVSEWLTVQHGGGSASREAKARLASAVKAHKDSNAYCATFARLWGVYDAYDDAASAFYFAILSTIMDARDQGTAIVVSVSSGAALLVLHSFLVDVVRIHFSERVPAGSITALLDRLNSLAVPFGTRGVLYVDQEAFLHLCLETRTAGIARAGIGSAEAQVAWAFESGTPADRFRASLNRFTQWQEKREEAISAAALREAKATSSECTFAPKLNTKRGGHITVTGSVIQRGEDFLRLKEQKLWSRLEAAQAHDLQDCTFAPKITPFSLKVQGKVFERLSRPGGASVSSVDSSSSASAAASAAAASRGPTAAAVASSGASSRVGTSGASSTGTGVRLANPRGRSAAELEQQRQKHTEQFLLRQAKAREKAVESKKSPFITGAKFTGSTTVATPFKFVTDSRVGSSRPEVLAARRKLGIAAVLAHETAGSAADVPKAPSSVGGAAWAKYAPLVPAKLVDSPSTLHEHSAHDELQSVDLDSNSDDDDDDLSQKLMWVNQVHSALPSLFGGSDEM